MGLFSKKPETRASRALALINQAKDLLEKEKDSEAEVKLREITSLLKGTPSGEVAATLLARIAKMQAAGPPPEDAFKSADRTLMKLSLGNLALTVMGDKTLEKD
jgi:predicted negative regulator of RcsB-dependent stress response